MGFILTSFFFADRDNGIIRTLDQPVYITKVHGKDLYILQRDGNPAKLKIDPTEFKFKLALLKRQYEEVLYIIRNSNLVGQSIIAYLQKKGYPEIALHFVKGDATRFELALECGNLDVAYETAQNLNEKEHWAKLAAEALKHGNFKMVELAYQRTKNYDRLSFLYLSSANESNLRKMLKIAEVGANPVSRFQNAMYLEDVSEKIRLLQDVGQLSLAYLTAKSHGLTEQASAILLAAGKTEDDVELPDHAAAKDTPTMLHSVSGTLQDLNWPLLTVSKSFFEGAFSTTKPSGKNDNSAVYSAPAFTFDEGIDNIEEAGGDWGAKDDVLGISSSNRNGLDHGLVNDHLTGSDDEAGGWEDDTDIRAEIDAEISNVAAKETAKFVAPISGVNESSLWIHTSQLATDHISAGSFETAMQVINNICVYIYIYLH